MLPSPKETSMLNHQIPNLLSMEFILIFITETEHITTTMKYIQSIKYFYADFMKSFCLDEDKDEDKFAPDQNIGTPNGSQQCPESGF